MPTWRWRRRRTPAGQRDHWVGEASKVKFPKDLRNSLPLHLRELSHDVEEESPARWRQVTGCAVNPGTPCRCHWPVGLWGDPPNRLLGVGCLNKDGYNNNFPGGSEVKASARSVEDLGSIPGSGRSPGEGNGNPLQYSCLENSMDGGAWWATVQGVAKSRTGLSDFTHSLHSIIYFCCFFLFQF